MPTPCSPVSTPPAAMHVSRISVPASCTRSHTPGSRPIEHDERVQVAVAGVEHVHRDELVRVGDLVDAAEHLDELRAGHDRVVQVVVGRDAGDRAERRLASLPQQRALARRRRRRAYDVAPFAVAIARTASTCSATPAASPSSSTSSTASASRG